MCERIGVEKAGEKMRPRKGENHFNQLAFAMLLVVSHLQLELFGFVWASTYG